MTFEDWWAKEQPEHGDMGSLRDIAKIAWNASKAQCQSLEGWETVQVQGLDDLVGALERAQRKGYLPDACTEEWDAFDYRKI